MTIEKSKETEMLLVTASGKDYSLPVSEVAGVLTLHRSAICPVPYDTENRIRGLFNYKGGVAGLIRAKGLVSQSDEDGDENLTAVLLRNGQNTFAILVDNAREVTDMQCDRVIQTDARTLYCGANDADDQ